MIGVIIWIVELGPVDITCEVSEMASMMAILRIGNLDQLYHIFAHLKFKHNAEMVFYPTELYINESLFPKQDWAHTVYGDVKEEIPIDLPKSRGFGFIIRAFVDADHAGDFVTRRSRTGFIIFLNNAPIYWHSKSNLELKLVRLLPNSWQ